MERSQLSPTVRQLGERLFLVLGFHPTDLLWQRLARVLQQQARRAGYGDPDAYARALLHAPESDLLPLAEALTVNETYFFREPKHFDALAAILPELARSSRPIRLLSAGCATGEEAYSLAIIADQVLRPRSVPFEVIGVDIDRVALERAKAGRYRPWSFRDQGLTRARDALEPIDGEWQVRSSIRRVVRFEQCNLVECAPAGPFHVIFCRNMLMYLTAEHRRAVIQRLLGLLTPGGLFVIGSAETLDQVPPELERQSWQGATIYRRRVPVAAPLPLQSRTAGGERRVLVVSRSPLVRMGLRTVLAEAQGVVVIGEERSWRDAEHLVEQADVLVLDALTDEHCLEEFLTSSARHVPALVLATTDDRVVRGVRRHLDVLVLPQARFGAVQAHKAEILTRLYALLEPRHHRIDRMKGGDSGLAAQRRGTDRLGVSRFWPRLFAIGASTGGPAVVADIVRQLPAGQGLAVLVVQHMPAGFTRNFAERLGRLSAYTAKEAQTGDVLHADMIYVAPGHQNLVVERGGRLRVVSPEPGDIYIPNITRAFRSIVRAGLAPQTMAVLLTGMGDDGGDGMAELLSAGAYTVVQDPREAVVSGMIEAALARQGVRKVMPAADIPGEVARWLTGQTKVVQWRAEERGVKRGGECGS